MFPTQSEHRHTISDHPVGGVAPSRHQIALHRHLLHQQQRSPVLVPVPSDLLIRGLRAALGAARALYVAPRLAIRYASAVSAWLVAAVWH